MTRDEAMKWAEKIGPFKLKYRKSENYSGEHREWYESLDVPQGNPDVAEAAATVIQQAFAERDGEDRMALQIIANPDWTWATVAEMREIARQALAAKGDSRG